MPPTTHAYWEAKASAKGYSNFTDFLQTVLAGAEQTETREEFEAKILEGIEALDRGDKKVLTEEDWERWYARARRGQAQ